MSHQGPQPCREFSRNFTEGGNSKSEERKQKRRCWNSFFFNLTFYIFGNYVFLLSVELFGAQWITEIMTKIINTLPVIYRPFVSSWRHVPLESQTLLSLTYLLMQEERENAKWTPAPAQASSVNNVCPSSPIQQCGHHIGRFQWKIPVAYQDYSQNHGTG